MSSRRLPEWIREKKLNLRSLHEIKTIMRSSSLHTVCEELACPNRTDCFSRGTATFMILGDVCTRACGFCNSATGLPSRPPAPDEPRAVAATALKMGLRHVVVTSVNRDDLPDGGARQFAETIAALRELMPAAAIEVLTPDFKGDERAIRTVAAARPDYYNHNVETVPRLYRHVRPGARFERSTALLSLVKQAEPEITTKSGLMVGLGETLDEVVDAMARLREAGCQILTIGQYLQPSRDKLEVVEYVHPSLFEEYRVIGEELGFDAVFSGPFVRSSYMADIVAHEASGIVTGR
ncbi:MAG: lipoyl synthase [Thermoanaerobaculia bacterium]